MLLGASGSGKSTLLNILGGLDVASSGRVYFQGRDITHAAEDELTQFRRHNVGFVLPLIEVGDPGALEIVVDLLTTAAVQVRPWANESGQ